MNNKKIDKKEFEYEMTQVLLHLQGEFTAEHASDANPDVKLVEAAANIDIAWEPIIPTLNIEPSRVPSYVIKVNDESSIDVGSIHTLNNPITIIEFLSVPEIYKPMLESEVLHITPYAIKLSGNTTQNFDISQTLENSDIRNIRYNLHWDGIGKMNIKPEVPHLAPVDILHVSSNDIVFANPRMSIISPVPAIGTLTDISLTLDDTEVGVPINTSITMNIDEIRVQNDIAKLCINPISKHEPYVETELALKERNFKVSYPNHKIATDIYEGVGTLIPPAICTVTFEDPPDFKFEPPTIKQQSSFESMSRCLDNAAAEWLKLEELYLEWELNN